jgi:tetratricopeptide (TPR) repeat protein
MSLCILAVYAFVDIRTRPASKASLAEPHVAKESASPALATSSTARSTNTEASALYRAGLQAAREASVDLAQQLFQRATELDPSFAAAHLAWMGTVRAVSEAGRIHYRDAMLFRDALNEEERAVLDAYGPFVAPSSNRRETAKRLEPLVERSNDPALLAYQVDAFYRRTGDAERSLRLSERTLERFPSLAMAWAARAKSLLMLRRNDEAEASLTECLRAAPRALDCLDELAGIRLASGDCSAAESLAQSLIAASPRSANGYLLLAWSVFPRTRSESEALAMLGQSWERSPADQRRWVEVTSRFNLDVARGEFRDAARLAQAWAGEVDNASDDVTRFSAALHAALALYETGDTPGANAVASKYLATRASALPNVAHDTSVTLLGLQYRMGTLDRTTFRGQRREAIERVHHERAALSETEWGVMYADPVRTQQDAIEALDSLPAERRFVEPSSLRTLDGIILAEDLSHVCSVAGDVEHAIQYATLVTNACGLLYNPQGWVRAHLDLGRVLESIGKSVDACKEYSAVADQWKDAAYSRSREQAQLGVIRACGGKASR